MSLNTIKQTKDGRFKLVLSRSQYYELHDLIKELVEITSTVVREAKYDSPGRITVQVYGLVVTELFLRKARDFQIVSDENHITLRHLEALCIIDLVRHFGHQLSHFKILLGWVLPELQQKTA